MNKADFNTWKDHSLYRHNDWLLDQVFNGKDGKDILFHRGSRNGQFVLVSNGEASLGNYKNALVNISNADFDTFYRKEYNSNYEALTQLVAVGGLDFIPRLFDIKDSK